MAKAIFGNHASVLVPRQDRASIRKFYCDVLGGEIMKADPERDFIGLGGDFYIAFLYGDVPDESEFLRSSRAVWLELKSDDVEQLGRRILECGLVRKLDVPDSHLYFQAPGGQCLRLVGIDEDLSHYEGAGDGPDMGKIKEALERMCSGTPRGEPQVSSDAVATKSRIFHCRLVPPRSDFATTLSEHEKTILSEHADYWRTMLAQGNAVLFGPVADPGGTWGLCIVKAKEESTAHAVMQADPAVKAGIGMRYEILPMISAVM